MLLQQYIYTCDARDCDARVVSDEHQVPKDWCVFNTMSNSTQTVDPSGMHGHLCGVHTGVFRRSLVADISKKKRW